MPYEQCVLTYSVRLVTKLVNSFLKISYPSKLFPLYVHGIAIGEEVISIL